MILALGADNVESELKTVLGNEQVQAFFQEFEPTGAGHFGLALIRLIVSCCSFSPNGTVSFDGDEFLVNLEELRHTVQTGVIKYSHALRLVNIDINQDFELASGVLFRKLDSQVVNRRYPVTLEFTPISSLIEKYWLLHRVEVSTQKTCRPAQFEASTTLDADESLVRSILDTFALTTMPRPYVTHVVFESPLETRCCHWGSGDFRFKPYMLSDPDIAALKSAYRFLQNAQDDPTLVSATDRFILGKSRSSHNSREMNRPNWDKLVDYAIAMETLLLTVNGTSSNQELSYRFRLNGSSLLPMASDDHSQAVFYALKCFYELRSIIVHGGGETRIEKCAKSFLSHLQIWAKDEHNSHEVFELVIEKIESWITAVLFHLHTLPKLDRPYRAKDGWEKLLWRYSAAGRVAGGINDSDL